ncbi:MAG TPA: efflux RND transporter periplasmic adaptor subunit [Candidatus Woesebacteria bacterium]|nr:efflux RND transporter periplasmic adaptor subunit [Candidatus Woesebacteria bacterium]
MKKVLIIIAVVAALIFGVFKITTSKKTTTQSQTYSVTKGTLVTSISATGTITSGNSTNITTSASGTVSEVFVKNGDSIKKDQKIATLILDDSSKTKQSNAYAAYLKAKEAVATAVAAKVTADIQMWTDHQAHLTALGVQSTMNSNNTNPKTSQVYTAEERMVIDKTVDQAYLNFKASELKYQNAPAAITNAKVNLASAYNDYLNNSATILAPADGVVNNLTLAPGVVISEVTGEDVTTQTIGIVNNINNQFQATVNLTESDVTKIKADQKVSLTLDAFSDKTFTGKVLAVNTSGTSTSGVTSYPVTILLDSTDINIYSKMSVSAQIITNIYHDVLLISNNALSSLKSDVVTGETDGTNTIVKSGLSEGDKVTVTSTQSSSVSNTSSPFSSTNRTKNSNSGGMMPPGF